MTMKRVALALFGMALISSPAFAASANADATATVVTPIQITKDTDLAFGKFAAGTGGTIVIGTDGTRTKDGNVTVIGAGNTAAKFTVGGEANCTYAITIPVGNVTLTSAGGTMTANAFTGSQTTGTLSALGSDTFTVGATLTAGNAQAPGAYSGTFAVSVDYN